MVVIMGINIPEQKLVKKALQSFYGIGPNISARLCARLSIHPTAKIGSLSNTKATSLDAELNKMTLDSDLRRRVREDIQRLKDMGTYRGRRHAQGLPVRGQNTKSQIKTARKLNRVER